jgi:hypothetical protein
MVATLALVAIACSATDDTGVQPADGGALQLQEENMNMDPIADQLLGNWRRISEQTCAQDYPESLEFREYGNYLAPMRDDVFWIWQSGEYELVEPGIIRIQSANDAMLRYRMEIDDSGALSFEDDAGCRIRYERME